MYSPKIEKELKKEGIGIGDRIKVQTSSGHIEGILMPRPGHGDGSVLVVKMDSGYNVGLKALSFTLIAKRQPPPEAKAAEAGPAKGAVSILGSGGTIASRLEYTTGAVYPSISADELRMSFPQLSKHKIRSRQVFSLFSEDMNSHHWVKLADAIEAEIMDGSRGVVVMHGTDTMTYTSAAISFMLQDLPVPVIFVGAQRSSDRPSSENQMNLLSSVLGAEQDLGEVAVCMHGGSSDDRCLLHRGTRVRKMHVSRRDAFRSINSLPLASIDYRSGLFEPLAPFKPRAKPGSLKAHKKVNDNVALIYVHPNIKPSLISSLSDYDGVVLAGTGLGHVPTNAFHDRSVKSILEPIKSLVDSDIPIVMSSQCISGRLSMRVYTNGRLLMDAGVIGDGADWTPETAYAKLCWALGQSKSADKVKSLMMEDIAGEISPRSPVEVL